MGTLLELPPDLPIPKDDGEAVHLAGIVLPPLPLPATNGCLVDLSTLPGRVVVYAYPRTGQPDKASLVEAWDLIPGARGCTPQSCAFRDHYAELQALSVQVYGLSTQTTEYQREAAERLHLPFPLLSDTGFELAGAIHLPMFDVGDIRLLKRLTWIARDGRIQKVFYPVFPPDKNAEEVIAWLRHN